VFARGREDEGGVEEGFEGETRGGVEGGEGTREEVKGGETKGRETKGVSVREGT